MLPNPHYDLAALRDQFPITKTDTTYLNHAANSPICQPIINALHEWEQKLVFGNGFYGDGSFSKLRKELIGGICQLIHAEPCEIALVPNTGYGMNILAQGLPFSASDNVITCEKEFPTSIYPWWNRQRQGGATLRIVPTDQGGLSLARLAESVDDHTRAVVVSSVEFLTGYRTDLAALGAFCRERGIYFIVDGIQSLGIVPLDVVAMNIDFLVTGGMKALMGPLGQGFLYIRRELLEKIDPPIAGATSVIDYEDWSRYHFDLLPDATRYEIGTPNLLGMVALNASLQRLLGLGIENIDQWTTTLTAEAREGLIAQGWDVLTPPHLHASILTWYSPRAAADFASLQAQRFILSLRDSDYLRISLHCYNSREEIARLLAATQILREAAG